MSQEVRILFWNTAVRFQTMDVIHIQGIVTHAYQAKNIVSMKILKVLAIVLVLEIPCFVIARQFMAPIGVVLKRLLGAAVAFPVKSTVLTRITKVPVTALVQEIRRFATVLQFMVMIGVVLRRLANAVFAFPAKSTVLTRIMKAPATVLVRVIVLFAIAYSFMVRDAIPKQGNALKPDLW